MFAAAFGGPQVLAFSAPFASPALPYVKAPFQPQVEPISTPQSDLDKLRRLRDDIVCGLHPIYHVPQARQQEGDSRRRAAASRDSAMAAKQPVPGNEPMQPPVEELHWEGVEEEALEQDDDLDVDGEEIPPPPPPPPAPYRGSSSDDMDEGDSDPDQQLIVSRLASPPVLPAARATHTRFVLVPPPVMPAPFSLPPDPTSYRPPPPPPAFAPASLAPPYHAPPFVAAHPKPPQARPGPPGRKTRPPRPSGPRLPKDSALVQGSTSPIDGLRKETRGERKDREARELIQKKAQLRLEQEAAARAGGPPTSTAGAGKRPGSPLVMDSQRGPPNERPYAVPVALPRSSYSSTFPSSSREQPLRAPYALDADREMYRPPPPPPPPALDHGDHRRELDYERRDYGPPPPLPPFDDPDRRSPERRPPGPPQPEYPRSDFYADRPYPGSLPAPRYPPARPSPPATFSSYHPPPPPRPLSPPFGHPEFAGRDPYGLPPAGVRYDDGYGPPMMTAAPGAERYPYDARYRGPPRSPPRDSYVPYPPRGR